jgi:hypothetical protein
MGGAWAGRGETWRSADCAAAGAGRGIRAIMPAGYTGTAGAGRMRCNLPVMWQAGRCVQPGLAGPGGRPGGMPAPAIPGIPGMPLGMPPGMELELAAIGQYRIAQQQIGAPPLLPSQLKSGISSRVTTKNWRWRVGRAGSKDG